MKNLNLSLIALLFSSLLMGCGLKGPLYREAPPATQEEQAQTQKNQVTNTQEDSNVTETEEVTQ